MLCTLIAFASDVWQTIGAAVVARRARKWRVTALRTVRASQARSALGVVGRHRLRRAATAVPTLAALRIRHSVAVSEAVHAWRAALTRRDFGLERIGVERAGRTGELVRARGAVRTEVTSVARFVQEVSRISQTVVT